MIAYEILQRFKSVYSVLVVMGVRWRMRTLLPPADEQLSKEDIGFLIVLSSQLSFGVEFDDEEERAQWSLWVYDAMTRLAMLDDVSHTILTAVDVILTRLGNFPARTLLRRTVGEEKILLPVLLAIQSEARELENTVTLGEENEFVLTDFQVRLLEEMRQRRAVSFSAPTSAGKSFLLGVYITQQFLAGLVRSVIYIVPTRALIRQVVRDVRRQLDVVGLRRVLVMSAPIIADGSGSATGTVYVLTQERLVNLLCLEGDVDVDAIFVDEAQELGAERRGLTLHSAIQQAIGRFHRAKLFFSSPLTSNPDYLLSEFGVVGNVRYLVERTPAVSQTLIFLKEVPQEPHKIAIEVVTPIGVEQVGVARVGVEFRGVRDRLAQSAVIFSNPGETTLVYANGAADAERMAATIASMLPDVETADSAIVDFIEFLKTHIHPKYNLIPYLPKGVAFHYGKMPHIVRRRVEELARDRKLRFVCCTSTLLQGVNLPAKNIFMSRPRRGNGKPLTSTDFWNLAGRAGRLREEFCGYVWCVDKESWELDPLEGPRLGVVSSAFRTVLSSRIERQELLRQIDDKNLPSNVKSVAEQAFGKIFSEFALCDRMLADSIYANNIPTDLLRQLDERLEGVSEQVSLPGELFIRNPAISPWRLEALKNYLVTISDLKSVTPRDPHLPAAAKNLQAIFGIIDSVFFMSKGRQHMYMGGLALQWIQGKTLAELIRSRLEYYRVEQSNEAQVNARIRELQGNLEDDLRFRYVRYLKAYSDVLAYVLRARGKEADASSMAPLHLYIEMGAYDSLLIIMMSLGLSRTTAILLRRGIARTWQASRENCADRLRELERSVSGLPEICWREVREIIGR